MTRTPVRHEPQSYAICLRGHLDARWAATLGAESLVHLEDGTTSLRCVVADQSALHGLLQKVRDLGMTLISVVQNDPDQPKL